MWIGEIGPIAVSDVVLCEPLLDIPFGFRPSRFPRLEAYVQTVDLKAWAAALAMAHSQKVTA